MGRPGKDWKFKQKDGEPYPTDGEDDYGVIQANLESMSGKENEPIPGVVRITKKPKTKPKWMGLKPIEPKTWKAFADVFHELYENAYTVNSNYIGETSEEAIEKVKPTRLDDITHIQAVRIPTSNDNVQGYGHLKDKAGKWIAFIRVAPPKDEPDEEQPAEKETTVPKEPEKKPSPPTLPKPEFDHEHITWARLRPDGSWGVRVPNGMDVDEGSKVEVLRKDGTTSSQVLDVCIWKNEDVRLYSIKKEARA